MAEDNTKINHNGILIFARIELYRFFILLAKFELKLESIKI